VHAEPLPLFTATVYVPDAVTGAADTVAVALVALDIVPGPVHEYPATFDAPLALRVSVLPAHMGPLFDALVSEGCGFTVTDVVPGAQALAPSAVVVSA
jgi:hypothetical protein